MFACKTSAEDTNITIHNMCRGERDVCPFINVMAYPQCPQELKNVACSSRTSVDKQTDRQAETSTVTLAAHTRRAIIRIQWWGLLNAEKDAVEFSVNIHSCGVDSRKGVQEKHASIFR